ncbi:sensor histidine kinase [Herbidospora mongoliensis]|uniref:sensor histidine kinase n=1 Tax=Herbidospora mongoliensis TaxID=688067 RepID=UPI000A057281|nr:histidine kinase [Herbidospora mongoliensis]
MSYLRWRVTWWPDLVLAASGVALSVLASESFTGAPPTPGWTLVALVALCTGLPVAFLRYRPVTVAFTLAALLVVFDNAGPGLVDGAQILLPIVVGVVARERTLRWTALAGVAACLATAVNLADPGIAFTANYWYYVVGIVLLPVLVGRYLQGAAERRDRGEEPAPLLDVLFAAGGVAYAVLGTWSYWDGHDLQVGGVGLLAVLSGLALGAIRWLPGAVLLFESALVLVADSLVPPVADSLRVVLFVALAVFAGQATWRWLGAGYLLTCGVTLATVIDSRSDMTGLTYGVVATMVVAPAAIGAYVGVRRTAARREEELRAERARSDRLAERERIAREVHDIVAHHIGAIVLRAGAAQYAGAGGPAAEALADIRDTGHQVLEDLRGLLAVLRDPGPDATLPVADPDEVMRDAAARVTAAGIEVVLDIAPETARAALVARASAARIVQEGLTNVLKHAGEGSRATVSVTAEDKELVVEIRNTPGKAPMDLPSSGHGVAGMRERTRALGGRLTAGPLPDGGWRLVATFALSMEVVSR